MPIRRIMLAMIFVLTAPLALSAKETKDVPYPFKNADPVIFRHDVHLAKYNKDCKTCHDGIFDPKNPRHYTMEEMGKGKSCGACHTGAKAFGIAEGKDCVRCHTGQLRNIAIKVDGATDAIFSHTSHSGAYGCNDCHGKLLRFKPGVKHYTIGEKPCCGDCHDGKVAFPSESCEKCHPGNKPRKDCSK
jgi:c(7)-type cytochrome triheme protein